MKNTIDFIREKEHEVENLFKDWHIEKLAAEMENFAKEYHIEQLQLCAIVGQSEQLLCECCKDNLVEEQGDWCNDCLENPGRVITN